MATPTTAQIQATANLYVALFNRAPDTAGLSFWSSAIANGASLSAVTQGFLAAPEGLTNYPSFQSGEDFIKSFYLTVFGRAADTGGLAFWQAQLTAAGGVESAAARASVVSSIVAIVSTPLSSADAALAANAQTVQDRALFANKVDYGIYVATQTPVTYVPGNLGNLALTNITADPASVETKKAGLDVFNAQITTAVTNGTVVTGTAGNDIFKLTDTQLNAAKAGFALDGAAGTDTLILTTGSDITATTKNISNIELINVTATGAAAVDATKFAGATTFSSLNSGNNGVTFNKLAAGQSGGVVGTSAGTNTFAYAEGVLAGAVKISGGTTAGTIAVTGTTLTSVAVSASGVANTVGTINLTGATGVTAVTVDAATALTLSTGLTGGKTSALAVTVNGAGKVNLGNVNNNVITLNAAGNSAGVTATLAGNASSITTVTGGAGADTITLTGAVLAGSAVTLGAGADSLLGTATFGAGVVLDGGDGVDTISAYLISSNNLANVKNFELLDVSGSATAGNKALDLATVTGSTFTGLVLNGGDANGTVTLSNVATTTGLTVKSAVATGTTTIGVLNASTNTADVFNITFDGAAKAGNAPTQATVGAGTIALANIETINIASGGGDNNWNSITISDAALKTLNITGAKNLDVAFAAMSTSNAVTIDGSAATGALAINTSNITLATVGAAVGSLTVKGGAGADTLTLNQVANVSGGAGADKFLLGGTSITVGNVGAATATEVAAKLVTITDFVKGDVLDLLTTDNGSTAGTLAAVSDLTAQTSLLAAANAAANAGGNGGAVEISAFNYGGDTYVLLDAGASSTGGIATGDVLVKLAGVVALTGSTDIGTGVFTFA